MSAKQRILVTGGTGFLGAHVLRALTETDHRVVVLVRDPASPAARRLPRAVKVFKGDIRDADSIRRAAKGCDALIHCAGMVSRDPEDALEMSRCNVEGTRITLDAAAEAGIKRVVYASTSGTIAISRSADPIADEESDTPLETINRWPYYRTKLYGEQEALARNTEDFQVVVVNPTLLLGPGDYRNSSTEDVRAFLQNKLPVVPSGGVSFVDVRDAALGILKALERGRPGQRYLLTACNIEVRTFFERLGRLSNTRGPIATVPSTPMTRAIGRWVLDRGIDLLGPDALPDPISLEMGYYYWYADSSRAEGELGWTYRDPTQTLLDTVADLRARGAVRRPRSIFEQAGSQTRPQ